METSGKKGFMKDVEGAKKVIIAMPVDRLPLEGKTLVACFMEIDMVSCSLPLRPWCSW